MKSLIFIIMTGMLLSSCNIASKSMVQPEGKLLVDGKSYTMVPSEYEWSEDDVEVRDVGTLTINELADEFGTIDVEKDAIVKVEIDKSPSSITIYRVDEDGTVTDTEYNDGEITMPNEAGYYIYKLHATWGKGKSAFIFDVVVD